MAEDRPQVVAEQSQQNAPTQVESPKPESIWRAGIAKIKNLGRRGATINPETVGDSAIHDTVNTFDALTKALGAEDASDNRDLSIQNNNGLARRFVDQPGFGKLFPGVDSIVIGEGREVRSAFYKEGPENNHKSVSLSDVEEIIVGEKKRLGIMQKVAA